MSGVNPFMVVLVQAEIHVRKAMFVVISGRHGVLSDEVSVVLAVVNVDLVFLKSSIREKKRYNFCVFLNSLAEVVRKRFW